MSHGNNTVPLSFEDWLLNGSPTSSKSPGEPETMLLEVSNFDRQIIVAIDGQLVFEPYEVNHAVTDEALEATVSTIAGQKMNATKAAQISLRLEQQNGAVQSGTVGE